MQSSNRAAFTKLGVAIAGVLSASAAGAIDMTAGDWKFSVDGNVNVHYIYSSCEASSSAQTVAGGLACTGSATGSSVSSVGNGLLPAAITFGMSTTQSGYDIAAHFGFYPGIVANDGGSPNLPQTSGNFGLGTTGLDIRQVYLTFGNKDLGTFSFGRNFGLFGFDAIINDMTLPGVGVAGSMSGASPANTSLGSIGLGYIYCDTLAQMNYTTPDVAGFNLTLGIFEPVNAIFDGGPDRAFEGRKAPGFHAKATYTYKMSDDMKFYASITGITQKQDFTLFGAPIQYTSNGGDIFAKFSASGFEVDASYYTGKGMGTTGLFLFADDGLGHARKSDGYLIQGTYTMGAVKVGVNYGVSKLDLADSEVNPTLVNKNSKVTGGVYYSLTKNLTLLGEISSVKAQAQNDNQNKSTNGNFGAFISF